MRLQFIFQAIARFRILIFYSFSKYVAARLTIAKRWGRIDLIAVVPERPTETVCPFTKVWACGAAGSALPWHGRGRRFDPDQVHQISQQLRRGECLSPRRLCHGLCHNPQFWCSQRELPLRCVWLPYARGCIVPTCDG